MFAVFFLHPSSPRVLLVLVNSSTTPAAKPFAYTAPYTVGTLGGAYVVPRRQLSTAALGISPEAVCEISRVIHEHVGGGTSARVWIPSHIWCEIRSLSCVTCLGTGSDDKRKVEIRWTYLDF